MDKFHWESYSLRLFKELKSLENRFIEILLNSQIERYSQQQSVAAAFSDAPPKIKFRYKWGNLSPELEEKQSRITREFQAWMKHIEGLLKNSHLSKQRELTIAHRQVLSWLEYRKSGGIPASQQQAINEFKSKLQVFYNFLENREGDLKQKYILIPDTNVLIDCLDVKSYGQQIGIHSYSVIILSTVISELDDLKNKRPDKNLETKVSNAIRYLRDWRQKGDVLAGIQLDDKIVGIMKPTEPNFKIAPDWLDSSNNDDKIVASALEIQQDNLQTTVIVLSNDINMFNKCSLAKLACAEIKEEKII